MKDEREYQNTPYKPYNIFNNHEINENTGIYSSVKSEIPLLTEVQQMNMYIPKEDYFPETIIAEDDDTMHIEVYNTEHFYNHVNRNLMF